MRPRAMANGGMVARSDINIPERVLAPEDPDRVLVRLQPGEMVIPLPHVKKVGSFLRKKGIVLPGM